MATKLRLNVFNALMIWWWIVNCIIGLGIPRVVESRYLPTRRSSPSDDRFDRLRELLHDVSFIPIHLYQFVLCGYVSVDMKYLNQFLCGISYCVASD